jgi:serine/threonine-protein kinase
VQGQKIDSRADLFSVGVVLYQLLTDKRPFDGDNDFSIIHQIIGHHPPAPSTINDRLPTAIDAVVARALAKNRDERFATARDFASALQSAIRRAEDQTVVPPPNPLKNADNSGTGSGQPSNAGIATSPSTVTQEVELVYWKDIKDSADPDEFEAFLAKFPAGIYADLARKRLRKLQGGGTITPDQTMLSGMAAAAATATSPGAEIDDEATRVRTGTKPSMVGPETIPGSTPVPPSVATQEERTPAPVPAEALAPDSQPASEPVSDFPSTITLVQTPPPAAPEAPAPSPAPTPKPATARQTKAETAPRPKPAAARPGAKPPRIAVLAGAGVVLVAAVVAFLIMGRGDQTGMEAMPAASSAASEAAPAASTAALPAASMTPTVAASEPHTTAAAHARPPSKPVHAKGPPPKPKVQPAAPAPVEASAPAPAPPPAQAAPKPAPAPSKPRAELAAVDACRDKVFVAREFCLSEACEKPGARNHPLCVEWRAEKRLRENSRIGN